MNNVLYSDMRRVFKNKFFYILMMIVPFVLIIYDVIAEFILKFLDIEPYVNAQRLMTSFGSRYAALLPALFVAFYIGQDFRQGFIRNKLVTGIGRTACFISATICTIFSVTVMQLIAHLTSFGADRIWGTGDLDIKGFLISSLLRLCSSLVISVLFVTLAFLLGDSNLSYAAGGLVSVVMLFVEMHVSDKLHTPTGEIKVTGTTLKVYEFIDKNIAFSYTSGTLYHEAKTYIIGCSVFLIAALVIGIVGFGRKEVK